MHLTSHLASCTFLLCSQSDKSAAPKQRQLQEQPNRTAAEQPDQQPPELERSGLLRRTFSGWHVYLQQPVLPAAFALALLYLTVMSLGKRLHAQWRPLHITKCSARGCAQECLLSKIISSYGNLLVFRVADDGIPQVVGHV